MPSITRILNVKNPRFYFALCLGILTGLSTYCYWFIDIWPPTSKWSIVCTGLISLLAAFAFLFFIELWITPRLSEVSNPQKGFLLAISISFGAFVFFAGTSAWKAPERYPAFLLPNEKIEITASPSDHPADTNIAIQWFSTSLGSVSFNSMKYQGWQRKGDLLMLANPVNNSLEWEGKTGDQISIVFSSSTHRGSLRIAVNGDDETFNLAAETGKQHLYTHNFPVPFYASRTAVILVGLLDFSLFCFVIGVFILHHRIGIADFLNQTIPALPSDGKGENENQTKKGLMFDWGFAVGAIALAILLRVLNLDRLSPITDEYHHLLAAKAITNGASILSVSYQRSLLPVTLPVALFLRVFGNALWVARLPGVLFNAFAIIPLYLLTKKINRPVAFLACSLYAFNPWLIAVSRYVREYGYYPFYFYWVIFGMIVFYENLPDDVSAVGWKGILKPSILFPGGGLLLPIIYITMIDPDSTFKLIAIAYGVFGLFVSSKIIKKNKVPAVFITVFVILLLGAVVLYSKNIRFISFHNLQSYWLRYFFPNPPQQWYFNRFAAIPIIGFAGAALLAIKVHKFNFIPSFLFALFTISLLLYMFFFDHYIQARYLLDVEFWFIPLVAIGYWCIWLLLKFVFSGSTFPPIILSAVLLAFSINGSQILLPTLYDNYGWMPITEEYHDDIKLTQSFLRSKVKQGEALISTDYAQYVSFEGNSAFGPVYTYNYIRNTNTEEYFSGIITQNDSGWIVLDDQVYDAVKPFPLRTTLVNNKKVDYVGKVANEYLWQWNPG